MFNGERLTQARHRRGLTKVALAGEVGLTARRISTYENQGEAPPDSTLTALAESLHFPVSFFMLSAPTELGPDDVSFRSFSRLSARDRDAALAAAGLATEVAAWITHHFETPSVDLPDLRDLEPAAAAAALRGIWGLGELPAPNIVHLLEAHGVFVFSLVDDCAALDAISAWVDDRPYVFLTRHKTPERARWDAAHELGHLLLHLDAPPHGKTQEIEADVFARELLLPERGFLAQAPRFPSLQDVLEHKVFWSVSAMAYIRRLHQLGRVTEWRYKSLVIEASEAGYRRREGDIERETSQLIPNLLGVLAEEGTSITEIATELNIAPPELRGLLFSPLSIIEGEGQTAIARTDGRHLSVVNP